MKNNNNYTALALFSGGLDSVLSLFWMKKLGYNVIPVFFKSFFFTEENAQAVANNLGLKLVVVDISNELLEVLKAPRYGFGKHMNPCIDCHALMFKAAGSLMQKMGADFLISGEVLAQRPMSQRYDAMNAVKNFSGYKDYIIRPLSQKLLPDTLPIIEGWVNKDEMLDIQGRSRKRQMEIAEEFGITEYQTPGGGCLLADEQYSARLSDLIEHNQLQENFIKFLNVGRHFRISPQTKLIVGRKRQENERMVQLLENEIRVRPRNVQGPLGIVNIANNTEQSPPINDKEIELAASILLSFSNKSNHTDEVQLNYPDQSPRVLTVTKIDRDKLLPYRIMAK